MPVNHEGLVDYIINETKKQGVTLDPAEVMQMAGAGLKANGYTPTVDDFGRISDIARNRVGTPTKNEAPSLASQYGSEVADTFGLAGKKIALGANAAVGGLLNAARVPNPYGGDNLPVISPEYRDALAQRLQQQAQSVQTQEAGMDPFSAAGSNLLAYSTPVTGLTAALGDTTNKAVQMQDQGKDLRDPLNRLNLGVTAGTNAALSVVPTASALGQEGRMAAAALAGTGVVSNLAATGLQGATDYATGNEQFAPGAADYAVGAGLGLLPGAHALPAALRGERVARQARITEDAAIAQRAQDFGQPANRGDDVVPAPVGQGVLPAEAIPVARDAAYGMQGAVKEVPGSEVASTLHESYTPEELKALLGKKAEKIGSQPVTVQEPAAVGSIDAQKRIDERTKRADQTAFDAEQQSLAAEQQASPLSPEAQAYVDSLPPERQTALAPSVEHLRANPDPKGYLGNLQMIDEGLQRRANKTRIGAAVETPREQTSPSLLDGPLVGKSLHDIEELFNADKKISEGHLQRLFKEDWKKADRQLRLTGEVRDDLLEKHGVDLSTDSPDYKAIYQSGYDAKDYRTELGNLHEAENLQTPEDMGHFLINNLYKTLDRSGDELANKLRDTAMAIVSTKMHAAGADPVAVMRKAGAEQIQSGLRDPKEVNQIAELIQGKMKDMLDEKARNAPEGKRYLVEPETGKARLVTDYTAVDPKETVAYADLSPAQQNRVDVAEKNTQRKLAGRNQARTGASMNPADALIEGGKAVGKLSKELLNVTRGDTNLASRTLRYAEGLAGASAIDRLARSSHEGVRKVAERFNEAFHVAQKVKTETHEAATKARALTSIVDPRKEFALRRLDKPNFEPGQNWASSDLMDMYTGAKPRAAILKDVFDGVDLANKATYDIAQKSGLPTVTSDSKNVLVRRHTPQAQTVFDGNNPSALDTWVKVLSEKNGIPEEVVLKDWGPSEVGEGALVGRVGMEQSRKYPFQPAYIKDAKGKVIKMIETDPHSYVEGLFQSTADRIGFHSAFEGASTGSDLAKSLPELKVGVINKEQIAAVNDAVNAYHNVSSHGLDANDKGTVRYYNDAKKIISNLMLTATAYQDALEHFNLVGSVPVQHVLYGVANRAMNPGRAVREGGLEKTIYNKTDLRRGDVAGVSPGQTIDNVANGLRRGSLRNTMNRSVRGAAYESARSWITSMRKDGISLLDEGYAAKHHLPDSLIASLKDGSATDADIHAAATRVAENVVGESRNRAQQGTLSRNDKLLLLGPLFRRYAENRIRTILRTMESARGILSRDASTAAKAHAFSRIVGESVAGLGLGAAATTAATAALYYGMDSLRMMYESGDYKIPVLVQVLGGGPIGNSIQETARAGDLTGKRIWQMLVAPFGLASTAVSAGEKPADAVPAVKRINRLMNVKDMTGPYAYNLYKEKTAKLFGKVSITGGEGPSYLSQSRADLRKALLEQDYKKVNRITAKVQEANSDAEYNKFIRSAMLLHQYRDEKTGGAKLIKLRLALGPAAFKRLQKVDNDLEMRLSE
jgi:hypothetical protein